MDGFNHLDIERTCYHTVNIVELECIKIAKGRFTRLNSLVPPSEHCFLESHPEED